MAKYKKEKHEIYNTSKISKIELFNLAKHSSLQYKGIVSFLTTLAQHGGERGTPRDTC